MFFMNGRENIMGLGSGKNVLKFKSDLRLQFRLYYIIINYTFLVKGVWRAYLKKLKCFSQLKRMI